MLTRKLSSSQDIADAIIKQQNLANEQRIIRNEEPIQTIPIIHRYSNETIIRQRVIKDLKCYYHLYTNDEYKLCSTVFYGSSGKSFFVNSKYKELEAKSPQKTQSDEKIIEAAVGNLEKLSSKNEKIKKLIEDRNSHHCNKK